MGEPLTIVHDAGRGPEQPADWPVFYYDLGSPECYLAAERLTGGLDVVPEWQPVRLGGLAGAATLDGFRCANEREIYQDEVARRAAELGLQPLRWPAAWPPEGDAALLAATYAKSIGRAVAFSLAAFRQEFAGGHDLGSIDTVMIAAAANEMHPRAVHKALELRSTREALDAATAAASAAGVRELPALRIGTRVVSGADEVVAAASAAPARALP